MRLKVLYIILITLIVVITAPIVFITWLAHDVKVRDQSSKASLSEELKNFSAPAGCIETSRTYQKQDIDAVPQWSVYYKCDGTGGAAYDSVIARLKKLNATRNEDFSLVDGTSVQAVSVFYSFTYKLPSGHVADYRFGPMAIVPASNSTALYNTKINSATFQLRMF